MAGDQQVLNNSTSKMLCVETPRISIGDTYRPVLVTLKFAGQYYDVNPKCKTSLSCVMCVASVLAGWANFVRLFFSYAGQDTHSLMTVILFHLWCLHNALSCTYFCWKGHNSFHKIFTKWDEYYIDHNITSLRKSTRRHPLKGTLIFWITLIVTLSPLIFVYIRFPPLSKMFMYPLFEDRVPIYMQVFFAFFHIYNAIMYFAPILAIGVICKCLVWEFQEVTAVLWSVVNEAPDTIPDVIEDLRQRHLALSRITYLMDELLSRYVFFAYALDVITLGTHGYIIIGQEEFQYVMMIGIFISCFLSLVHIISLTSVSNSLTNVGYSAAEILYGINIKNLDSVSRDSVQMFIRKLTTNHNGLTVWKMFPVDKRIILAVLVIVLSYLGVMVWFGLKVDWTDAYLTRTNVTNHVNVTTQLDVGN